MTTSNPSPSGRADIKPVAEKPPQAIPAVSPVTAFPTLGDLRKSERQLTRAVTAWHKLRARTEAARAFIALEIDRHAALVNTYTQTIYADTPETEHPS